ncbi:peptide ABC transporter substrate-binding protein [Otariodibacter sp.]|uniref:peptide ABC transporter substrate-binding protein n=1 Tax=Otariodibacter sp. TaxID=3030919 RepID=UPI002612A128|nr:peptide ABC transporter substrate-binding protein [Otariodibacter sp.]
MKQYIKNLAHFKGFLGHLIVCSVLSVLIVGCDQTPLPQTKIKIEKKIPTELNRAIYSAYIQLDPHFIKVAADAAPVRDLFLGLMRFDPKGNIINGVAESYKTQDSKHWVFKIRNDVIWSNGEPVTADDFVESWKRLLDPRESSPLAQYLIYMGLENAKEIFNGTKPLDDLGIHALNSQILQIDLKEPNQQLPKMLAHVALLPTYHGKKPEDSNQIIVNGDYEVISREINTITLHSRKENNAFKTVKYQLIGTAQNPDRFDIIENPLKGYRRNIIKLPQLCTYFYEFNFNDSNLSKKEIRQAIRAMVSSSDISKGFGIPDYSVLPSTMTSEIGYQLSSHSAEQFFEQLGLKEKNILHIKITFDNEGKHEEIANRIARTLGQSDLFRVTLDPVSWESLLKKRDSKNFQLIRSGWCADYNDPVLFLNQFHSTSLDNKSGYSNSIVDEKLEKLKISLLTEEERDSLILEIIKQLEEDVAILPLFQYQRRVSVAPDIVGVDKDNTSEVIYSKDLYRNKEEG